MFENLKGAFSAGFTIAGLTTVVRQALSVSTSLTAARLLVFLVIFSDSPAAKPELKPRVFDGSLLTISPLLHGASSAGAFVLSESKKGFIIIFVIIDNFLQKSSKVGGA